MKTLIYHQSGQQSLRSLFFMKLFTGCCLGLIQVNHIAQHKVTSPIRATILQSHKMSLFIVLLTGKVVPPEFQKEQATLPVNKMLSATLVCCVHPIQSSMDVFNECVIYARDCVSHCEGRLGNSCREAFISAYCVLAKGPCPCTGSY